MRVRFNDGGEVFEGEPIEIIEAMQFRAWGWEDRPIAEYMTWLAEQACEQGAEIEMQPALDDNTASQLIFALIEGGLLTALSTPQRPAPPSPDEQLVNEAFERAALRMKSPDDWGELTPEERVALVVGQLDRQWRNHGGDLWQLLGDGALLRITEALEGLDVSEGRVLCKLADEWDGLRVQHRELDRLAEEDPEAFDDQAERMSFHETAIMDAYREKRDAILTVVAPLLSSHSESTRDLNS